MAKATHIGHCQVCGSRQKLPNGLLAKHGYTVDYGFFNGVCFGAGHLPFEQSKDLVVQDIARCVAMIETQREVIKAINADKSVVWIHQRIGYSRGRSLYMWIKLPIAEVEFDRFRLKYKYKSVTEIAHIDPRNLPAGWYDLPEEDKKLVLQRAVIEHQLGLRVADLKAGIASLKSHITRQQVRADSWAPAPLEAIQGVPTND